MMQEISDQSSRTVLLNTFVVKKKRCRVYFHRGTLIWETEKPPYRLTHRPRKILLFVNPFGGKKKGLKIWEKDVQPLMTIAGIETKMLVTERVNHIRDILLSTDLTDFHAVVCIGGDGTLAEVINGLVLRTSRDRQIDPNNPEANLPTPRLPIGVIPSGSTDTVAYSLHGTTDVQTAAIHIIFGDSAGLDISSVHNDHTLLRLYASMLSYGYLGDVIRDSEKFRWMGPQRYDYSGFKKILGNKGYEGEIQLLSDPCHPATSTRCTKNCTRCLQHMHNSNSEKEISRWMTVRGKFFMVNGANLACGCARSPMGFSPHCHIGDGCVDVILVRHTSLFNNIRMLLRLSSKQKTLYDLPFVEVYRAREFTFRALPTMHMHSDREINNRYMSSNLSVWNCDGEVIDNSNVKIRVHCQLVNIFTRRAQEPVHGRTCFC
ncbi:ceramide kinase isoform X3 [Apis mellifera]|uniref:Ceramide kinase isoform X3 n=1 Tax=Apis mellifera TaxID=7460 RepID=A0A7M7GVG9_APIME|nr:ceramide kinase isoform X3 [Apis mellifera]|eukprot:XP_006566593.1 ceramide kinase isoform X3 [Apis mellifera]